MSPAKERSADATHAACTFRVVAPPPACPSRPATVRMSDPAGEELVAVARGVHLPGAKGLVKSL